MSARLKERRRHVERLIRELESWAADIPDLRGVCVVGSYARGTRECRQTWTVLLSTEPDRYGSWLGVDSPMAPARFLLSRTWGSLTELRFLRQVGLQLDAIPAHDGRPTSVVTTPA